MQEITISRDHGSIFGYVADIGDEQIHNFFTNRDVTGADCVIEALVRRSKPVAFLCNLYVDEGHRGNGLGQLLFTEFQEEAALLDGALIILICDNLEAQLEGFSLQAWYEGYGFKAIELEGQSPCFPLMALDADQDFFHLLES